MRRISLWASNFLFLVLSACGQEYKTFDELLKNLYQHTVPIMQPEELHNELKRNPSLVLVDAREKREFEVSHLKGAVYAGYDDFDLKAVENIPKDARIIVYCSVGYRSERIGEKLLKAGYKNVYNLYGGIFEWKNSGFAVYSGDSATEKVHAYSGKWGKWLTKGVHVYE